MAFKIDLADKQETKKLIVEVPVSVFERIARLVSRCDMSRDDVVRQMLAHCLENMEEPDPLKVPENEQSQALGRASAPPPPPPPTKGDEAGAAMAREPDSS